MEEAANLVGIECEPCHPSFALSFQPASHPKAQLFD
jgi:hypothetical protein